MRTIMRLAIVDVTKALAMPVCRTAKTFFSSHEETWGDHVFTGAKSLATGGQLFHQF
jgi:hypothetical protein